MSMPVEQMENVLEEEADLREPEMDEGEIVTAMDREIRWAGERMEHDLNTNRVLAWEYFQGSRPGKLDDDVEEYFQSVVSRDVADAIEATLAEILPAFATDRPAAFDPTGPGDEDQANLESDICNDILMEAGSGYLELSTAAKNALMLRIGALETIWDEREEIGYQTFENVQPEVLSQLMQDPDIEVREIEGVMVANVETGQNMGTMNIEVRTRTRRQRCIVEAVPADEILISSDCQSMDLDKARFVGRKTLVSRSDLIAKGYDREIVENLPAYTSTQSWESRRLRERNYWGREKNTGDEATDLIQIVRAFYRLDEDRDGIAELRRIVVAGKLGTWVLIEDEPIDYQPFAIGAGYIWPHQPYGISLYDKLKHVQDIKTKFLRIQLEAGQRAARDRVGLLPGTNIDDWQSSQFGGAVRMTSPNGVTAIPNPQYPAGLADINAIADKMRREGGGGATDKSNQEAMPVEAGAHGVERMMTAIEELNAGVARLLAETLVRGAYLKIHHTLRLYSPPIPRQLNGQWMEVDPRQWQPREKMSVATGLTLSERGRLAGALQGIIQNQKELIQQGSTLANPQTLYRAVMDQARLLGLQNPESYMVDPQSPEGMQAQAMQQQARQEQMAQTAQMAQQQLAAQGQMLAQVEAVKTQGRMQSDAMQVQGDLQETLLKIQADQQETAAKLAADQSRFMEELGAKYDEMRLKLVEIEAKHGEQEAPPMTGETP